jgi:hypothetical protein
MPTANTSIRRSLAAPILAGILAGASAIPAEGQALYFDGATAYGQAPAGAPIQDSTWEFWVRLDVVDSEDADAGWPVAWWGSWTGTPALIRNDGSIAGPSGWGPHTPSHMGDVVPPGTLGAGEWHHVAGVFSNECGPGVELYFDGQPVASYGVAAHCPSSYAATTLAAYNYLGWNGFFRGRLDEVRISSVPRYSASFVPERRFAADSSTWGLWHFDEGAGSTAADEIAGRDFQLVGGYSWVPESLGTPFCSGLVNSTGVGSEVSASGSLSVAAQDLTLAAVNNPPGQVGLFFYGPLQLDGNSSVAMGNGLRCVGGPIVRIHPPTFVDGAGEATRVIDWSLASSAGLLAGTTQHVQFWYRDPDAGGAGFNFSNGLSLPLAP